MNTLKTLNLIYLRFTSLIYRLPGYFENFKIECTFRTMKWKIMISNDKIAIFRQEHTHRHF